MNLHLTFIAFAVIATVAAASENLRKSATTDTFFEKKSAPMAKRTQERFFESLAKSKGNMQKMAANARNSGAAKSAGKALTAGAYGNFYTSEVDYPSDACSGTVDFTLILSLSGCDVESVVNEGVTYMSYKYQSTSDCTSIQQQLFTTNDCTGTPFTTDFAATFDSDCNGDGLVYTGDMASDDMYSDDDDNEVGDSFSSKYAYCGWDMPTSTVESPQVTNKYYADSMTCQGTVTGWVYLSATCANENGGGSLSVDSSGIVMSYSASNCAGTGVISIEDTITLGCTVETADDADIDDFVAGGSNYVTYVSPAAHWSVNAGLAALLAAVACMAI
jgi:hypothetical protein